MDQIGNGGRYPTDLGAQLARFRLEERLSQAAIAERLKVDQKSCIKDRERRRHTQ